MSMSTDEIIEYIKNFTWDVMPRYEPKKNKIHD